MPHTTHPSGPDRQAYVYTNGIAGTKPAIPVSYPHLAAAAQKKMSREAFAYVAGGAGLESTLTANRQAFDRWKIVPRMLRDVSVRDMSAQLFNQSLPAPLLLAPVGVLELAHKDADLAVAKAAGEMGIPMIFSSQASVSMETCTGVMGDGPRWFQLYWSKSDRLVESLVGRAEACGCTAIVVTLDTTMLGWRTRDLDLAYLPFLRGKGIAQYVADPVFQQLLHSFTPQKSKTKINWHTIQTLTQMVKAYPGSFFKNLRSGEAVAAVQFFISTYSRPSLTWEDLSFLRSITKLPILLKGILHVADARLAADHGMDGIIVSNHGGRQVDGALGTLDALPAITEAVGNQLTILLDSGIRCGADIFKALALGAKGVCVGRPYVYALALKGQAGVQELVQNLLAEFDLTMGLAGCKNLSEITRDALLQCG
ncbi:MAG: lactate 2-monooxygenase [Williamsia sp.]|nr:lactate 2-monooxygenase [Williamsia sp.]